MESGVTNTTLTSQSSSAFTDKTPETVIEIAQSNRRNIPATNELKDVNFVENEASCYHHVHAFQNHLESKKGFKSCMRRRQDCKCVSSIRQDLLIKLWSLTGEREVELRLLGDK